MNLKMLRKLQNKYYTWIASHFYVNQIRGVRNMIVHFIRTPFHNFVGDNFMIYVTNNDSVFTLDDDGETINNFVTLDINLFTHQRKLILNNILNKYDVKLVDGDMLSISGKMSEFPKMEFKLILAMIEIDNMHILIRNNISKMFKDDMYNLFKKQNIQGNSKVSMNGSSGGKYVFDYVSNAHNHFNLIDFSNTEVTFNKITSYMYKFKDVERFDNNRKFRNFIIFNSNRGNNPSDHVTKMAKGSNIGILPSKSENLIIRSVSS